MATIFASADIAALVAAYRPSTPTKDRPSLVLGRRTSDEYLLDSRRILKQFKSLLEGNSSRIALSDLPSRLDIDNIDWLLACYEEPMYYNRDGRWLLTSSEIQRVWHSTFESIERRSANVADLASTYDLSILTLKSLINASSDLQKLYWYDDESTKSSHVYSEKLAQAVNDYLETISTSVHAKSEYEGGIDLCSIFSDVPGGLLLQLAEDFTTQAPTSQPPGEWQLLQGRAVFVPASHVQDLESKKVAARQARVEDSVEGLEARGYYRVDEFDMSDDIQQLYITRNAQQTAGESLVEIVPDHDATATKQFYLVRRGTLHEAIQTLHIAAPQETARIWHARDGSETSTKLMTAVFQSLINETHRELQKALLQSQAYRSEIEPTITVALEKLSTQGTAAFEKIILDRLMMPVQLYTLGVADTADETLTQHLNGFLGDYFRRDVLPTIISTLQEHRLLLDKPRKKDFDKMTEAISQAKVLPDVQAAITKLARKHKIRQHSNGELTDAKRMALEQKVRQLRNKKIARGSDILQNLIWILLAEKTDGLYMSSGKDTTRMVKLYSTVAGIDDAGAAEKLAAWRDALKAGKESQSMLDEMRGLASESVERWCAAHNPDEASVEES